MRAGVAGALAAAAAIALSLEHPIYAFIAAVIGTDLSPATSRRLGMRRIAATMVGAAIGAAFAYVVGSGPLTIGVGVAVAMIASYAVNMGEAARVAAYISGIVILDHADAPLIYAVQRLFETLLGVCVAWGISYFPKLIRAGPLRED